MSSVKKRNGEIFHNIQCEKKKLIAKNLNICLNLKPFLFDNTIKKISKVQQYYIIIHIIHKKVRWCLYSSETNKKIF